MGCCGCCVVANMILISLSLFYFVLFCLLFVLSFAVKLRMQFRNYKSRCLKLLFWILLIVYPSVSRKILMVRFVVEKNVVFVLNVC